MNYKKFLSKKTLYPEPSFTIQTGTCLSLHKSPSRYGCFLLVSEWLCTCPTFLSDCKLPVKQGWLTSSLPSQPGPCLTCSRYSVSYFPMNRGKFFILIICHASRHPGQYPGIVWSSPPPFHLSSCAACPSILAAKYLSLIFFICKMS